MRVLVVMILMLLGLATPAISVAGPEPTPAPLPYTETRGVDGGVVREFIAHDLTERSVVFVSASVLALNPQSVSEGQIDVRPASIQVGREVGSWALDNLSPVRPILPAAENVDVAPIGDWANATFWDSRGPEFDMALIIFGRAPHIYYLATIGFGEDDQLLTDTVALATRWNDQLRAAPTKFEDVPLRTDGLWAYLPQTSLVATALSEPSFHREWILVDGPAVNAESEQPSGVDTVDAARTSDPALHIVPGSVGSTREDALAAWDIPEHADPVLEATIDHRQQAIYDPRDTRYQITFLFQLQDDDIPRPTDRVLYVAVSLTKLISVAEGEQMTAELLPKDASPLREWRRNRFGDPDRVYRSDAIRTQFPTLNGEGVAEPGTVWATLGMVGGKVGAVEISAYWTNE